MCLEAAFKLIFGVSMYLVAPLSAAVLQERSPVPARVGLVPRWGAEGQSSACSKTSASELQRPIKIEIVQTSGAATQDFPGREGKGCTWAGTWVSGSGFPSCGDLNLNPKRGCSSNGLATKHFPSFREDDRNSKWPSLFFSYFCNLVVSVKPSESQDMGMSFCLPIFLLSSNLIHTSAGYFGVLKKIGKKGWFFFISAIESVDFCNYLMAWQWRMWWLTEGNEKAAIVFHGQSEWNDTKWSFITEISIVTAEASHLYRFRKIHTNRLKTENTLKSQIWEGQKSHLLPPKCPSETHLTNTKEASKPSTRQKSGLRCWSLHCCCLLSLLLPPGLARWDEKLERNEILSILLGAVPSLGHCAWGGLCVVLVGAPDPCPASQGLWPAPRNGVKVQLLINYSSSPSEWQRLSWPTAGAQQSPELSTALQPLLGSLIPLWDIPGTKREKD